MFEVIAYRVMSMFIDIGYLGNYKRQKKNRRHILNILFYDKFIVGTNLQ